MMLNPEMYAERFKNASYQEMIKERDSLMRYIRKYEKLEKAGDCSGEEWLIFACHNLKKMSLWREKYRRKPSKNSIYPSKYTKKDNFILKIAYIQ